VIGLCVILLHCPHYPSLFYRLTVSFFTLHRRTAPRTARRQEQILPLLEQILSVRCHACTAARTAGAASSAPLLGAAFSASPNFAVPCPSAVPSHTRTAGCGHTPRTTCAGRAGPHAPPPRRTCHHGTRVPETLPPGAAPRARELDTACRSQPFCCPPRLPKRQRVRTGTRVARTKCARPGCSVAAGCPRPPRFLPGILSGPKRTQRRQLLLQEAVPTRPGGAARARAHTPRQLSSTCTRRRCRGACTPLPDANQARLDPCVRDDRVAAARANPKLATYGDANARVLKACV
jgi:hypothetical protein